MKYLTEMILSISLIGVVAGCSDNQADKAKHAAAQAFMDCDFNGAITQANSAIELADGEIAHTVSGWLIIAKSQEALGNSNDAIRAYHQMVEYAPAIDDIKAAKQRGNLFVQKLSSAYPDKISACPQIAAE